jgi:predicted transcriptional regulator
MEGRRRLQNADIRRRKPYRDRVAIVAEILGVAYGGVQKTSVMYKVGMSSLMLNRYLRLMMKAKLLDVTLMDNKMALKATDRGKEFLHYCQEIVDLLDTESEKAQVMQSDRNGCKQPLQLISQYTTTHSSKL